MEYREAALTGSLSHLSSTSTIYIEECNTEAITQQENVT
jgi:hypothetical protein